MSGRRSGRRKSELRPVGGVVGSVLEDLGLGEIARAARVGVCWADAVGPEVASHARPEGMRGGVLEVSVDTSVWCQDLQMNRPRLLAALRERLGEDAPEDLRFRVGYNRPT
jgi:predicted nucleic acid-binding Zn ribbon protein